MILDKATTDKFLFIFNKKLGNFLENAPLLTMFYLDGFTAHISNSKTGEVYSYSANTALSSDLEECVKININEIKSHMMEKWYPKLEKVEYRLQELSSRELEKEVESNPNIPVTELMKKKKKISSTTKFILEKVNVRESLVFIKNEETGKQLKYKIGMPISIFLRKIEELSPEEGYKYLSKKIVG